MVSTPATTPAFDTDFLRMLQSQAQQLKDLIGRQITVPPSTTYSGPIPDLNLPFPHDIPLLIDDMSLPKHLCQQMKSKVTERIIQSQRVCIELFERTCRELPEPLTYLSDLGETYESFYNEHQVPAIRAKILSSKATLDMVKKHRIPETKRPTFNAEYTPLLEKYFEHNAYPSRPDRILLAKKSLMTERQIEVWFQNHRNRAKKEGRPLKRMSPHQLSPLEFLEQKTLPHTISSKRTPSSSQNSIDMSANRVETLKAIANPSNESFPELPPPVHTFPTPYQRNPNNSFLDPLPLQEGKSRFPPPNWPRKPAVQTSAPLPIDMEELIAMFATKLSIRRGPGMKSASTISGTRSWFSAIVTIPSPAPHPALVRTELSRCPSIPTSLRGTVAWMPITASNTPNLPLSSTSQPPARSKNQKIAPFPFRTPQKIPPPSTNMSSLHQPFGSRTSSFASVSSSQSRSSSASIGSSPEPTTPPHSPTADSYNAYELVIQEPTPNTYVDLFAGIVDPQYDLSQNLDYLLTNEDIFASKLLPTSTQNFLYMNSLSAAT